MPHICYVPRNFYGTTKKVVDQANKIIDVYRADGYVLTLRQLYYRFVAQGWMPNDQRNYKRLSSIITDARLAGLIDWDAIEDRTRELHMLAWWRSPEERIAQVAGNYREELWRNQMTRVEVWVEKEALAGVFKRICDELHVPLFATRGHPSASTVWEAAQRFEHYASEGQDVTILHFSDHDPSGVDMTRDVDERLNEVFGVHVDVRRIALTIEQIRRYNPPPNPCKTTDSRSGKYIQQFGHSSWELDALEPNVLAALVRNHVEEYIDQTQWEKDLDQQETRRDLLKKVSKRWAAVVEFVSKKPRTPRKKTR